MTFDEWVTVQGLDDVRDRVPEGPLDFDHAKDAWLMSSTVERARCLDLIRKFLVFDSQRAVSWHEIQDCMESIRKGD